MAARIAASVRPHVDTGPERRRRTLLSRRPRRKKKNSVGVLPPRDEDEEVERIVEEVAARMGVSRHQPRTFREKLWQLMEDPESSTPAYIIQVYVTILIIYSTVVFCVSTIPSQENERVWEISEIFIVVNFTLEYLLRIFSCPSVPGFLKSFTNTVDLLAILPFYLELSLDAAGVSSSLAGLAIIRVVRLARVFRLFKLGKHSEQFQLVVRATKKSKDGIMLLFFMLSLTVVFFSAAIYYAEQTGCFQAANGEWFYNGGPETAENRSPYQSIVHSMWWTIVTLVTVGYGDDVPETIAGRLVAALTMVTGVLVLAFPITLLGASFGEVYAETKEQKIRRKIEQVHRVASKVVMKKKKMKVQQLCSLYKEISKDLNDAIGDTRDNYIKVIRTLEYYQLATLELQQIVQAIVVAYELEKTLGTRSPVVSTGKNRRRSSSSDDEDLMDEDAASAMVDTVVGNVHSRASDMETELHNYSNLHVSSTSNLPPADGPSLPGSVSE